MDRTPSPRRLRTPPAPHHGFADSYEPYSPRRSTRVAAQRDIHLHHGSQQSARARRDITPTATSRRKSTARANNFTLSPPSSPISSPQHQSPRSKRRTHAEASAPDSESEAAPSTARRFPNKQMGLLPTPSETPRKRPLMADAALGKTARVLFPARPANIDEVMPTPRKSRKKNLFTLESFTNASDEPPEKIQIFTDSKERVPEQDDEEDNPFITKKGKGKGKAKATPQKSQRAIADSALVKETIDRDEGMVYLFRGRKMFRKFHDSPEGSGGEDTLEDFSALPNHERALRRTVGVEAHRPLRRSTIKPRLLFEQEIKERKRQNGEATDDEEADTEIETPAETPSRRKSKAVPQPATPPPTVRKVKREISFESWSRVKSAHSSGESVRESKKRGGEALERGGGAKRARSEKSTPATSFSSI